MKLILFQLKYTALDNVVQVSLRSMYFFLLANDWSVKN